MFSPLRPKSLSGLISGKEWDKEWLQYNNGKPHPIPNPVRQNYRHTVALKQLLKAYPNNSIFPIVVFFNASRLDVTSENTLVVNRRDLLSAIKSYCSNPVLTSEQVHLIAKDLSEVNIKDRDERRQHREQVQMKKELFSSDELSKAYEEGKNSPVLHFTQHFTLEERILQEKIDYFRANGPVLTIRGHTDTIYGFLRQARRNKDNSVADDGKAFDHITCPYTGAQFPPSELANLERGLWLSYFNKHPELAHHVSTKQGLTELFPSRAPGYPHADMSTLNSTDSADLLSLTASNDYATELQLNSQNRAINSSSYLIKDGWVFGIGYDSNGRSRLMKSRVD